MKSNPYELALVWPLYSDTGCAVFPLHFRSKSKELSGATTGMRFQAPGPFHQAPSLHQTTEVLLMQSQPSQSLHYPLQLVQSECRWQKFEYDWAILNLSSYATKRRSDHSAMIERHAGAKTRSCWINENLLSHLHPISNGLTDQACFIEQFVSLQNPFTVPGRAICSECNRNPVTAISAGFPIFDGLDPSLQQGQHFPTDHPGWTVSPIFPGQERIAVHPFSSPRSRDGALPHQSQVGN
jgi:hypothetical protein